MAEWDAQVAGRGDRHLPHMWADVPTHVELSQHLMDDHDEEGLPTPGPSEPRESESQKP